MKKYRTLEERLIDAHAELEKVEAERSNLMALATLIENNGVHNGPVSTRYDGTVKEITVGIGPDNTATVRLFPEDIEALRRLLGTEEDIE